MDNLIKEKSNLIKMLGVFALVLCLYFIMLTVSEFKNYRFIGGAVASSNTISFDGKGEISASPDIAIITFTLTDNQKDLKIAQDKVTAKETAVLAFLATQQIDKKDIKTESYTTYPKYDYGTPCYYSVPCPQKNPVIIGYEVSEHMSVKIRDIAKVGEVVKGVGLVGVNNMSGPNFSIDNEDGLKAEARKMAIDDAREKAKVLAKDLGVKLVRVISFYENDDYRSPTGYYDIDRVMSASVSSPAPELPSGENKITSSVTITYEIR